MAVIHVERKRRRSVWPWVILILLIAAAAWAVYTYGDRFGLKVHSAADLPASALALAGLVKASAS